MLIRKCHFSASVIALLGMLGGTPVMMIYTNKTEINLGRHLCLYVAEPNKTVSNRICVFTSSRARILCNSSYGSECTKRLGRCVWIKGGCNHRLMLIAAVYRNIVDYKNWHWILRSGTCYWLLERSWCVKWEKKQMQNDDTLWDYNGPYFQHEKSFIQKLLSLICF